VMRVSQYDEGCSCFVYSDASSIPMP
jgi:hypothetical protein